MHVGLDFTLADLYGVEKEEESVMLVSAVVNADTEISAAIPMSNIFIYHDMSVNEDMEKAGTSPDVRALAIRYLAIMGQRYSFHAGAMLCAIFSPDTPSGLQHAAYVSEIEETFRALHPSQRPMIKFCHNLSDIQQNITGNCKLVSLISLDPLIHCPHIVSPDLLYELQSKRCLAFSGLPTPKTDVIDFDPLISPTIWIKQAMEEVTNRPLPFVLKLQQAFSGAGTYIIRTEMERKLLLRALSNTVLPKIFSKVNVDNQHLFSSTLILQDVVSGSDQTFTAAFFVHKNGSYTYISCTDQETSFGAHRGSAYEGSYISYSNHDQHKNRVQGVVNKVALFLHLKGYYGACGIDMMEDESGTPLVVDMNVRPTSSFILGCLKGHFWDRRGLSEACMKPEIKTKLSRTEFNEKMSEEIRDGSLIIPAWFVDTDTGISWVSIVAGGLNETDLGDLVKKVYALAY